MPIEANILTEADYRTVPWKNGQGTTKELLAHPDPALGKPFVWRLSVADVLASGPFSDFAGYDRTIMVVSGQGMELSCDGAAPKRLDQLYEFFAFRGEATTECRLIGGPIKDFNLMVARAYASATLDVVRPTAAGAEKTIRGDTVVAYVLEGAATLRLLSSGRRFDLSPGNTLVVDRSTILALEDTALISGAGALVLIDITTH